MAPEVFRHEPYNFKVSNFAARAYGPADLCGHLLLKAEAVRVPATSCGKIQGHVCAASLLRLSIPEAPLRWVLPVQYFNPKFTTSK